MRFVTSAGLIYIFGFPLWIMATMYDNGHVLYLALYFELVYAVFVEACVVLKDVAHHILYEVTI